MDQACLRSHYNYYNTGSQFCSDRKLPDRRIFENRDVLQATWWIEMQYFFTIFTKASHFKKLDEIDQQYNAKCNNCNEITTDAAFYSFSNIHNTKRTDYCRQKA